MIMIAAHSKRGTVQIGVAAKSCVSLSGSKKSVTQYVLRKERTRT